MSASGLLTPLSPHIQHNNTVVLIQTLVFFPWDCIMHFSGCSQLNKSLIFAPMLNLWTFLNGCPFIKFK